MARRDHPATYHQRDSHNGPSTPDCTKPDGNSDASSVCSERSYGSRNGGIPHYLRQTEDVAEVLNHCASSNWAERKEGLLGLQNLLKSQRTLR